MAIIIQPSKRLFQVDLHAIWDYRELLFFTHPATAATAWLAAPI